MPPQADADVRETILAAFTRTESGDCVEWSRDAKEHLRELLPKFTWQRVNQMLREGIARGGKVTQIEETREGYREGYAFHYDFVISIGDTKYYMYGRLLEEKNFDPQFFMSNFKLDSKI